MLKNRAVGAVLPAMVLCATFGGLVEKPESQDGLAKGTRPFPFHLHKDQELPDGAVPGAAVDIVGVIREPIETGITIVNVKLLAVDANKVSGVTPEQWVTVQLTPLQREVLGLMIKHGVKLGMKLHRQAKAKP